MVSQQHIAENSHSLEYSMTNILLLYFSVSIVIFSYTSLSYVTTQPGTFLHLSKPGPPLKIKTTLFPGVVVLTVAVSFI